MATQTLQITTHVAAKFTYTIIDEPTRYGITLTSVTFICDNDEGASKKLEFYPSAYIEEYYNREWVSVDEADYGGWLTIPKGTKTKTFTKTKTTTVAASKSSVVYRLKLEASWRNEDGSGSEHDKGVTVASKTVVLPSYAIAFNSNGGTGSASDTKWYNESLAIRNSSGFSRSGFTFSHWNTQPNNTGTTYTPGATYTANAALTLYAIWKRTVSFNTNGGVGAPGGQTGIATQAITLTTAKPTRAGYVFKNWNTAANGSGTTYNPGGSYGVNLGSTTLYAQWQPTIESVSITANAIRTSSLSSTTETDEGTFAFITFNYSKSGAASFTATPKIEYREAGSTTWLNVSNRSTGSIVHSGNTVTARMGSSTVGHADYLDPNKNYEFKLTLTVTPTNGGTINSGVSPAERVVLLASAFYTLDVKAGGHGLSVGAPATMPDVFNVSMNPYAHGQACLNVHTFTDLQTAINTINSNAAMTPCIAFTFSDKGLYYFY